MLRRRQSKPRPRLGELRRDGFTIFVTGRLVNPLNQRGWSDWKRSRWTREWKDKVAQALIEIGYREGMLDPATPKRVTFVPHVYQRFDLGTEGLRAALKGVPDALKDARVLNDDRDSAGHEFVYAEQVIDRAWPGVEIRVEPRVGTPS